MIGLSCPFSGVYDLGTVEWGRASRDSLPQAVGGTKWLSRQE
jgi:hypothetical protein